MLQGLVLLQEKGADIETLKNKVSKLTNSELHLNIIEARKPEIDAALVAESIALQMERRVSFRRAMKRAVQNAMRMGALVSALILLEDLVELRQLERNGILKEEYLDIH